MKSFIHLSHEWYTCMYMLVVHVSYVPSLHFILTGNIFVVTLTGNIFEGSAIYFWHVHYFPKEGRGRGALSGFNRSIKN